jgi:hypothetical protein
LEQKKTDLFQKFQLEQMERTGTNFKNKSSILKKLIINILYLKKGLELLERKNLLIQKY